MAEQTKPLSSRVRPDVECAPWVIEEIRKLEQRCADAAELVEALQIAVRQNSHDMLMTGDELRVCEAALAAVRGGAK